MRRAEDEEDEDSRNGATKLCRKVEKNNFRPFFYVLLVSFLLHVTNAAPQDSVLLGKHLWWRSILDSSWVLQVRSLQSKKNHSSICCWPLLISQKGQELLKLLLKSWKRLSLSWNLYVFTLHKKSSQVVTPKVTNLPDWIIKLGYSKAAATFELLLSVVSCQHQWGLVMSILVLCWCGNLCHIISQSRPRGAELQNRRKWQKMSHFRAYQCNAKLWVSEILGSQEDSDYQPWESEELEPSFERDSRAALAPKESSAREPNQWERQARTAADSHLLRYTKRNAMPSAGLDFNPEGANHLMRLTGQDGRQGFDADAHLLRFNRAKQEEHWLRFNKRGGEAPAVDQPDPVRQPRYDDHFLRYSRGTDDHLLRYVGLKKLYLSSISIMTFFSISVSNARRTRRRPQASLWKAKRWQPLVEME